MNIFSSQLVVTVLLIVLFGGPANVKDKNQKNDACPTISMRCPKDDCGCGPTYEFIATVSGGDPNVRPEYKWKFYGGRIEQGQGTPHIKVVDGEMYKSVTASLEVLGYEKTTCATTASMSIICCRFER